MVETPLHDDLLFRDLQDKRCLMVCPFCIRLLLKIAGTCGGTRENVQMSNPVLTQDSQHLGGADVRIQAVKEEDTISGLLAPSLIREPLDTEITNYKRDGVVEEQDVSDLCV